MVTYYDFDAGDLFVQDSTAGIWVNPGPTKPALHRGEFVELEGFSAVGDLAPEIEHPHFRNVGEAPTPNPRRPTSDELASGRLDSQWIELEAVVRSVAERDGGLVLNVSSGAFECRVFVLKYPSVPTDIVDSQVRIRGVFAGLYDPNSVRVIGFQVLTPSWSDVKVLQRPRQAPWSAPVRPIRWLLRLTAEGGFAHRVRVHGVVTFQQLGRFLCIRDSEGALLVNSTQPTPLKVGDLIDAMGYPAIGDYTVIMRDAILQRVGAGPAPEPVAVGPEELRAGRHDADLVRLSARLLNCTTRPGEKVLELQADGVTFRATLHTGTNSSPLSLLRAGSLLQLTGVSIIEADENGQAKGFEILLRSSADVVVLKLPSWWTVGRIAWLLIMLAGMVFLISLWVAVLRRRVEERTETIRATLESTVDGIVVVNSVGRIVAYNRKFAQMWRIPESVLASRDNNVFLSFVLSQLKDPAAFLTRVRQTHADHDTQTDDVIEFKDGRVFEHHSEPQRAWGRNIGRVWGFRDITERKRAEDALRESETRFRAVFENAAIGIALVDMHGHPLESNPAIQKMLGYSAPELAQMAFTQFTYPDDEQASGDLFASLCQGERDRYQLDKRYRRKDGQIVWGQLTESLVRTQNGEPQYAIAMVEDISERKQAEKALRQSEQFNRQVISNAQEGVIVYDREFRYLVWNRFMEGLSGVPAARVLGKNAFDLFPHLREQNVEPLLRRALAGETVQSHDVPFLVRETSKSGWMSGTYSPHFGPDGEIIGVIGIIRDITERKQAEEALTATEEKFRKAFDSCPDPMGIRTFPEGRLLEINDAFVRASGYSREEAVDKTVKELGIWVSMEDWDRANALIARDGRVRDLEVDLRSKAGEPVLALLSAERIDLGGLPCVLFVARDITERKRAEEALHESEERFRTLVENATVGIYRTTPDGRVLMANPTLVKMMGCDSFEELACRNLEEEGFEPNYPRSEFKARLEREGEITGLEEAWVRRDGTTIFVREGARAKRGPNGNVLYYDGIVEDITERRRAEESRRYLASIVESSDDAIFGISCEGVIQSWNRGAEKLYGYTAAEMIGAPVSLLAPRNHLGEIARLRDQLNCGDDVQRYETVRVRKDGSQVDVLTTLSTIKGAGGRVIAASIIAHDITKRRRAQQELERSLEQLRALGARLQNVREEERKLLAREIHDQLGQALTAIKIDLFAWVSRTGGDPQNPPNEASALLRLVDETIKRVRRIATELRPGILDDLGLVAAIEWAGEDFEARTGIKCRLDLPRENIAISPEQATAIFRILQESLTNVVRHAAASEVKIRLGEKEKELILLVQDNGKGMRMDKLSRTRSLGILGMHERALVFGGEVIIKAAPGKGTTVRVRIPQVCLT